MKFRKRNFTNSVDAIQFDGENGADITKWSDGKIEEFKGHMILLSNEANFICRKNCWIVKDGGTYFVQHPRVFQMMFETET